MPPIGRAYSGGEGLRQRDGRDRGQDSLVAVYLYLDVAASAVTHCPEPRGRREYDTLILAATETVGVEVAGINAVVAQPLFHLLRHPGRGATKGTGKDGGACEIGNISQDRVESVLPAREVAQRDICDVDPGLIGAFAASRSHLRLAINAPAQPELRAEPINESVKHSVITRLSNAERERRAASGTRNLTHVAHGSQDAEEPAVLTITRLPVTCHTASLHQRRSLPDLPHGARG